MAGEGTELGVAGGLLLTAAYVIGAFLLDVFTLDLEETGRWLTILIDVISGTPSNQVAVYLLAPGFAAGVFVFGLEHVRGLETGGWSDLETLLLLVAMPVIGMFGVGLWFAFYTALQVVGVFGLPLALPFAVFFVAVADGVLLVSTSIGVTAGYALVRGTAYVHRLVATPR